MCSGSLNGRVPDRQSGGGGSIPSRNASQSLGLCPGIFYFLYIEYAILHTCFHGHFEEDFYI